MQSSPSFHTLPSINFQLSKKTEPRVSTPFLPRAVEALIALPPSLTSSPQATALPLCMHLGTHHAAFLPCFTAPFCSSILQNPSSAPSSPPNIPRHLPQHLYPLHNQHTHPQCHLPHPKPFCPPTHFYRGGGPSPPNCREASQLAGRGGMGGVLSASHAHPTSCLGTG